MVERRPEEPCVGGLDRSPHTILKGGMGCRVKRKNYSANILENGWHEGEASGYKRMGHVVFVVLGNF